MFFAADELDEKQAYKLLAGSVVPRAIAWVTTRDSQGVVNAAPYSFFTVLASDPPLVGFAVSDKRAAGGQKDTLRNAVSEREFVVNIVPTELTGAMHQTSADNPPGVSEVDAVGLSVLPSNRVRAPRIEGSPAQFECNLERVVSFEANYSLVVGRVVAIHVADDAYDPVRGYVLTERLNPVGRLIGEAYVTLGKIFELHRIDPNVGDRWD